MDHKKFEQLITLITNENTEQARALFHDIVVEKSREIYESMMDDEEQMGGQVGDLLDEINSEEQGMTEEDDGEEEAGDEDFGDIDDEESFELDDEGDDGFGDEGGEEGLEDRVVDLEDKLDELMAEFEEIMSGEDGEAEDEFGDEEAGDDFGDEEAGDDFGGEEDFGDEEMMESAALQSVKGLYGSKIGGDNGVQTKSPVTSNSGQAGMASRPVSASSSDEKGRTAPSAKDIPGTYKNAAGQKKQDLEAAPKPKTGQEAGANNKSPLGESRKRK